jgi:pyruvate ferredoxin oxidoreductase beta subunit
LTSYKTFKDVPDENLLEGGSFSCAGCGGELGLKLALKVMGKNTIVVNPSGCMTLLSNWPTTPVKVSFIHNAIENAAATATGINHALKALKRKMNILCYAGDGATYDIGFQSLSGAAARGDNMVYVCYNNSCYGNTGNQWSTATPLFARTTTTPPGTKSKGNPLSRKDMAKIMGAHGCYSATACTAFPLDYLRKLEKAKQHKGVGFIDLLVNCPTNWGFDPQSGIDIAKKAVFTGIWPLYEVEKGLLKINYDPGPGKFLPVEEFLSGQLRYRHLTKKDIRKIQEAVDEEWELYRKGKYWETDEY